MIDAVEAMDALQPLATVYGHVVAMLLLFHYRERSLLCAISMPLRLSDAL